MQVAVRLRSFPRSPLSAGFRSPRRLQDDSARIVVSHVSESRRGAPLFAVSSTEERDGLIRDIQRNFDRSGAVGVEVVDADAEIDLASGQIEGQAHGNP